MFYRTLTFLALSQEVKSCSTDGKSNSGDGDFGGGSCGGDSGGEFGGGEPPSAQTIVPSLNIAKIPHWYPAQTIVPSLNIAKIPYWYARCIKSAAQAFPFLTSTSPSDVSDCNNCMESENNSLCEDLMISVEGEDIFCKKSKSGSSICRKQPGYFHNEICNPQDSYITNNVMFRNPDNGQLQRIFPVRDDVYVIYSGRTAASSDTTITRKCEQDSYFNKVWGLIFFPSIHGNFVGDFDILKCKIDKKNACTFTIHNESILWKISPIGFKAGLVLADAPASLWVSHCLPVEGGRLCFGKNSELSRSDLPDFCNFLHGDHENEEGRISYYTVQNFYFADNSGFYSLFRTDVSTIWYGKSAHQGNAIKHYCVKKENGLPVAEFVKVFVIVAQPNSHGEREYSRYWCTRGQSDSECTFTHPQGSKKITFNENKVPTVT